MAATRALTLCVFVLGSAAIAAEGDGSYQVEFEVELSKGTVDTFTVEVYPKWAPLGAVRFKEIIGALNYCILYYIHHIR